MKKIVYIAGPITGDPDYKKKFDAVAKEIEDMGYAPYNPTWQPQGLEYKQYIDMALDMLKRADAVVFLPGYDKSDGATLENDYCFTVGMTRIYLSSNATEPQLKKMLKGALK